MNYATRGVTEVNRIPTNKKIIIDKYTGPGKFRGSKKKPGNSQKKYEKITKNLYFQ